MVFATITEFINLTPDRCFVFSLSDKSESLFNDLFQSLSYLDILRVLKNINCISWDNFSIFHISLKTYKVLICIKDCLSIIQIEIHN